MNIFDYNSTLPDSQAISPISDSTPLPKLSYLIHISIMALAATASEKFDLITSNLQEVLNPEIIQEILDKNERPFKIYWGTATTGKPHCGYFVPCLKIAEFLAAGCEVTILMADMHGFLDNQKAPLELIKERTIYYRRVIRETLHAIGVDLTRLIFKTGSDHQTRGDPNNPFAGYPFDFYRLSTAVSSHDASKAGSEVVKQVEAPPLSSQIYPVMQALDEEYLGVDAQFGGVDQRKIFTLASECLPRIGYRKRAHLMNPLIPGLQEGGKMSSSEPDSKIDLVDTEEVVRKKFKKAFCPPKQIEGNGVVSFVEFVLMPAAALKNNGKAEFVVDRRDAEPLVYTDIAKLKEDYLADILQPQTLKPAATEALLKILRPIRAAFENDKEWQSVEQRAYPPPPASEKKAKKEKKLGTKFPGAKSTSETADAVEAKPDGHLEGAQATEIAIGKPK